MSEADHDAFSHATPSQLRAAEAYEAGSFLYLEDDKVSLRILKDLQLKYQSRELALRSLLRYLDRKYRGERYFNQKARFLKRVAQRWLSDNGAGRRFWGADEEHIRYNWSTDIFVYSWAHDRDEIVYSIKELLVALRSHARRFYERRKRYTFDGRQRHVPQQQVEEEQSTAQENDGGDAMDTSGCTPAETNPNRRISMDELREMFASLKLK